MDILLTQVVDEADLLVRLQQTLPTGIYAYTVGKVALKEPALMASVEGFQYTFIVSANREELRKRVEATLDRDSIPITRRAKAKKRRRQNGKQVVTFDARPMSGALALRDGGAGEVSVDVETRLVDKRALRMRELLELLELDPATTRVISITGCWPEPIVCTSSNMRKRRICVSRSCWIRRGRWDTATRARSQNLNTLRT